MDDDVFDVSFVDMSLAGSPPGRKRRLVVGKDADDVELVGVDEIDSLSVGDLSAEHQMQKRLFHATFSL